MSSPQTVPVVIPDDPEFLNQAAQRLFPEKWASMEKTTGKRRSHRKASLRKLAKSTLILETLPSHATCETCEHRGKYHGGGKAKHICDLESDFHGYVEIALSFRCPRWKMNPKMEMKAHD